VGECVHELLFVDDRVGQKNHIFTVFIRYSRQKNHQIHRHIWCTYMVLANPGRQ
jgi:hypothetical protein